MTHLFTPLSLVFITTADDVNSFFEKWSRACGMVHTPILQKSRGNENRWLTKLFLKVLCWHKRRSLIFQTCTQTTLQYQCEEHKPLSWWLINNTSSLQYARSHRSLYLQHLLQYRQGWRWGCWNRSVQVSVFSWNFFPYSSCPSYEDRSTMMGSKSHNQPYLSYLSGQAQYHRGLASWKHILYPHILVLEFHLNPSS